jgi:IS1 family transposase
MNKLPLEKRVAILSALVEGNSLRSTSRMVGVSINTVTKMLVDAGNVCAKYQREVMKNLSCRRLQIDEIWSFCAMKQKNIPAERRDEFGIGDVWTWVAIDAETKLVPCWLVGLRDSCHAVDFVKDLATRLANRVQVTSDGLRTYIEAMEQGFGGAVDYAMLIKIYSPEGSKQNPETRYSPGECCGTETNIVSGQPEDAHISTSFVERQNLTMRMKMRRFTRLTNGFSKKFENHEHSVALHFFHYNFIRRHQTLRMPPALKAGVADHWWTLEELAELIDQNSN